jgi:hypothetical protein
MTTRKNYWLSPKENFIKKLEAYFNEKYNDFTIERISRLLDEYSEDTEITIKKIKKNDDDDLKYFK